MGSVIYLWMVGRANVGISGNFNPDHYGNLETDRGVLLYQEAGSECAEYPVDAVYAWDQPDLHFYVPRGDHFSDPADFCFQETLGVPRRAAELGRRELSGERFVRVGGLAGCRGAVGEGS
jgi:hypothetical protein